MLCLAVLLNPLAWCTIPYWIFAWCEIAIEHGAMSGGGCCNLALQQMTSHEDMLKAFQLVVDMRSIYAGAE
jgi:hypothetical protein